RRLPHGRPGLGPPGVHGRPAGAVARRADDRRRDARPARALHPERGVPLGGAAGARASVARQLVDLLVVDLLDALDRALPGSGVLSLRRLLEVRQRGLDRLVLLARELLDPGVRLV